MKKNWFIVVFFAFNFLLNAQTNLDFEATPVGSYTTANGVSGWTVSSNTFTGNNCGITNWTLGSPEFSIVSTPFAFPVIGVIPQSPLGGNNVARLNNSTANFMKTKLAQNFTVTAANSLFQFAYAGVWQDGGLFHSCCTLPGLFFKVFDCSGNLLACNSLNILPSSVCSNITSYTVNSGTSWTNWQVKYIDLSQYLGTCVTIEFMATDCGIDVNHYGTTFIDTKIGQQFNPGNCLCGPTTTISVLPKPVEYCQGSNVAKLYAPLGYAAYQWTSPSGLVPAPQGTMQALTINNPLVWSIYTLTVLHPSGCSYAMTYTIAYSQIAILATGSSSTCFNGSSGTATVLPSGSGSGYNYLWTNSSNSIVGTSSVVNNLTAGVYNVQVTAANNNSCGVAVSTITVNTNKRPTF